MRNYAADPSLERDKCGKGTALHEILSDGSLINDSTTESMC